MVLGGTQLHGVLGLVHRAILAPPLFDRKALYRFNTVPTDEFALTSSESALMRNEFEILIIRCIYRHLPVLAKMGFKPTDLPLHIGHSLSADVQRQTEIVAARYAQGKEVASCVFAAHHTQSWS